MHIVIFRRARSADGGFLQKMNNAAAVYAAINRRLQTARG
jgi:hypothetical protein